MKLLSPAGNQESLRVAVYNGADEVYLGINQFNARNNVDCFELADLEDAVVFSHAHGVKVLLAINVLFDDSEINKAINVIVSAYNLGVDAFIVQDVGLAKIISDNYPEIELHASTQMAVHNLEGVLELEKLNFKRVVLARETPLSEVKRIKENSKIEIEYFVHGALCVSFSGNCYLSSKLFSASGNKGKCKQLCRLPYTLYKSTQKLKRGYLLSAKDFCLIDRLKDLEEAGVDVLKIEGRARRPYYVGAVTREYRKALDNEKYELNNLKLAFNRDYTEGYFNGNGNIISTFNNHVGLPVGKVVKVVNGKKFNQVSFSSNQKISQKSAIKIFNNGEEANTVSLYDLRKDGNTYTFTTTQDVKLNGTVNLIVDSDAENSLVNYQRKAPIDIEISLVPNENIFAKVSYGDKFQNVYGEILQPSVNRPIINEELTKNFAKNELFSAKLSISNSLNTFMTKQSLNAFRREVFLTAKNLIKSAFLKKVDPIFVKPKKATKVFTDFEYVYNEHAPLNSKRIVYSPETYELSCLKKILKRAKELDKTVYLDTPNFALKKDVEFLDDLIKKTGVAVVVNNLYALSFNTEKVIGPALNVYNSFTANFYGLPFMTAESDLGKKAEVPYMTLRHCPLKNHLNASCEKCPYSNDFYYKTDDGKTFKLSRKKLIDCTFYLN